MNKLESWLNNDDVSDVQQYLLEGLQAGCDYFAMHTGIVSLVEGPRYTIHSVYSKMGDIFTPGMEFELKNTYCDAVVRSHKAVTYIHVGSIPGMVLHPVYTAVQLESYIGAPMLARGGRVFGTVNFSSHEIRQWEFDDEEIAAIERMAKKIARVIRD